MLPSTTAGELWRCPRGGRSGSLGCPLLAVLLCVVPAASLAEPTAPAEQEALRQANQVLRQGHAVLQQLRERQLTILRRLQAVTPTGANGEVLVSRAALLVEAAQADEDLAATYLDDAATAQSVADQAAANRAQERWRQAAQPAWAEAAELLEQALTLPLEQSSRILALQLLAEAHEAQGNKTKAIETYRGLATLSSADATSRAASFRLGETALAAGQLEEAIARFTAASGIDAQGRPASDLLGYRARHKLGWCRLQRNELETALTTFETLLQELARPGTSTPLREQIEADYVYALSQVKRFDQARAHLTAAWNSLNLRRFLSLLAESYQRDRRYAEALPAHQELLAQATPAEALERQGRIFICLAALERKTEALQLLARLLPELLAAQPTPGSALAEVQERVAPEARRLLLAQHDRLLTLPPAELTVGGLAHGEADLLIRLLQQVSELMPETPQPWLLSLARGNLLHRTGSYLAAAREFEAVLNTRDATAHHPAAVRGVALSLMAELTRLEASAPERPGHAHQLESFARAQLATATEPTLQELLRLQRAAALEILGRSTEALVELDAVVAAGGGATREAAEQILRLRFEAEDWTGLATAAVAFRGQAGLKDPEFQTRLVAIGCKSNFRLARTVADRSRAGELGIRLVEYAALHSSCPEVAAALLEAGRDLRAAGRLEAARQAYEQLLTRPPDPASKVQPLEIRLELAALGEALCDPAATVTQLLAAARDVPCSERAPLLLRAATWQEALDQPDAALTVRRDLTRQCPEQPVAARVLLRSGLDALRTEPPERTERILRTVLTQKPPDPERELAARFGLEALAFRRGRLDTLELEGLLAEYLALPEPEAHSTRAAAEALLALISGLATEVSSLSRARPRPNLVVKLADLTAALERWAATAASSTADVELRVEALMQAAHGLLIAESRLPELIRQLDPTVPLGAGSEVANLRDELRQKATELATRARQLPAAHGPWVLRSRLLLATPGPRSAWDPLAAQLVPFSGLQLPPPWPASLGLVP